MRRYKDIADFQRALGLSQREAAKMLNIDNGHLSRIKRGLQCPGLRTLIKLQEHRIKTEPFLTNEWREGK
jgi:transcriptional regulator with XRE-family HTH domain